MATSSSTTSDPKDTGDTSSSKTAKRERDATVDVGGGVSPEGVPYQGPSRTREEMDAKGEVEDPDRLKLERQISDLQDQLERHDNGGDLPERDTDPAKGAGSSGSEPADDVSTHKSSTRK